MRPRPVVAVGWQCDGDHPRTFSSVGGVARCLPNSRVKASFAVRCWSNVVRSRRAASESVASVARTPVVATATDAVVVVVVLIIAGAGAGTSRGNGRAPPLPVATFAKAHMGASATAGGTWLGRVGGGCG